MPAKNRYERYVWRPNLRTLPAERGGRRWSPQEDDALLSRWPAVTDQRVRLARELGRSLTACVRRVQLLRRTSR